MADFNLLVTLDVLLSEGSVAGAARRLRLSPSAMSRSLARLREVTGDPLLVRAGRRLVPTPRALELRTEVGAIVDGARAILRPAEQLDLARLDRRFVLRTSEGFAETFGPRLIAEIRGAAPGVTLQFVAKPDKESAPLRDGEVDIETGVIDETTAPEMRALPLFEDHWVGVARSGHPMLAAEVDVAAYGAAEHIQILRRGLHSSEVDDAAAANGATRRIGVVVNGFAAAISLARDTHFIATVPELHTGGLRRGVASFPLPFALAGFTLSMLWHPRMDGDLAHRWLRTALRKACVPRRGPEA